MFLKRTLFICTILLQLVNIYTLEADENESGARLLVSKQILNKYIVENMDLVVKYTIYNIGNSAAVNVMLTDTSFKPEVFLPAGGQLNVRIPRVPPVSNLTHTVVLRPVRVGFYNFSAAEVTYRNSDESTQVQVAISSEPGEGYIVAFRDYDKKFSPHLVGGSPFLILAF